MFIKEQRVVTNFGIRKDDPLLRPIVFRGDKKEVPTLHIKTNLHILDMSRQEFEDMIDDP